MSVDLVAVLHDWWSENETRIEFILSGNRTFSADSLLIPS